MKARSGTRDATREGGVAGALNWMRLTEKEVDMYRLLRRRPMTIRQLVKATRLSERMLRTHLDNLLSKDFVRKEPLLEERMKYVYIGNPEDTIYDILVKRLNEFRRKTK